MSSGLGLHFSNQYLSALSFCDTLEMGCGCNAVASFYLEVSRGTRE